MSDQPAPQQQANRAPTDTEQPQSQQPPSTTQPPTEAPKPPTPRKWLIPAVIGGVVALLGTIGFLVYQNLQLRQQTLIQTQSTPIPDSGLPSPTTDPIASWETYQNEELGIIFKYPSNLIVSKNNFNSSSFYSVIDTEKKTVGQGSGIVSPIEFSLDLNNDPLNVAIESSKKSYIPQTLKISTVTSSGGVEVTVLSGTRAEGYLGGEKTSIAYFKNKNNQTVTFQYFGYVLKKTGEISEDIFNQILSTLKFTDQNQTDETANWETYIGRKYSFKYPQDWVEEVSSAEIVLKSSQGDASLSLSLGIEAAGFPCEEQIKEENIKVGNIDASKTTSKGVNNEICGDTSTTRSILISLKSDNKQDHLFFRYNTGNSQEAEEVLNQILSTFTFTE